MARPFLYATLSTILLYGTTAFAQSTFMTKEYVDVNNVKSAILVHGDLNWNPVSLGSDCEFPTGSGVSVSSATTLWMAGFDQQAQLHVSAQTFRQTGNDFWPGPLENGSLNMATSTKWAKIWKVNFFDINTYLAQSIHTINNTPDAILEWPAKGNPYAKGVYDSSLTITTDMAPFVDADSDGVYDPLKGDYPEIK
ncbi:MAG: hypothetical protein KDC07_08160, partial [Chitinophagaceae bacterium]|nr:hypothetical protein [Chitinophagaceae bacterium]